MIFGEQPYQQLGSSQEAESCGQDAHEEGEQQSGEDTFNPKLRIFGLYIGSQFRPQLVWHGLAWEFGTAKRTVLLSMSPSQNEGWWCRAKPKSSKSKPTKRTSEHTELFGQAMGLSQSGGPLIHEFQWLVLCFSYWNCHVGVYPTVSNRDGKKQLPPSKTDCSQPEPFRILGCGGAWPLRSLILWGLTIEPQ